MQTERRLWSRGGVPADVSGAVRWGLAVLVLQGLLEAGMAAAQVPAVPVAAPDTPPPGRPVAVAARSSSGAGASEGGPSDAPLSAIDWLSESLAAPPSLPVPPPGDIAVTALPADVSVAPLSATRPDAVGLVPPAVSGLPRDLWGGGSSADIAGRLDIDAGRLLPALRDLFTRILIAEVDPPADAGQPSRLLVARLDALLTLGALDEAQALLDRAGAEDPALFRRAFDVGLLTGREAGACRLLQRTPDLSPTFPARIFCLARAGDWTAAALTLETGRALRTLTAEEDALLTRFLDDGLDDGAVPLPLPVRPSPLEFRLFEAIGEPVPTTTLPRAYAHADLRPTAGWKAQIEAAERLAAAGAIPPNRLLGLYTERRAAASGGVWDRVTAFQAFDRALGARDAGAVTETLPQVWDAMAEADLEIVLADLFARELAALPLTGEAGRLAWRLRLLSADYEAAATDQPGGAAATAADAFLAAVARGQAADAPPTDERTAAIAAGFAASVPPTRLATLLSAGRLGEAILRALVLVNDGASGDYAQLSDGLALLRLAGLEDTARRAALQLLILDRRG
jgi:hypothetical protein